MKHLISARHALSEERPNGSLTDRGREQITQLVRAINPICVQRSIYLVTATSNRAHESGLILAQSLGLPTDFERVDYLWSASDGPEDRCCRGELHEYWAKLDTLLQRGEDQGEVLIVFSHEGVERNLARRFAKSKGVNSSFVSIDYGQALYVNSDDKTVSILQ